MIISGGGLFGFALGRLLAATLFECELFAASRQRAVGSSEWSGILESVRSWIHEFLK